jgi:signal transduction histidine kinase
MYKLKFEYRITLLYLAIGALWILLSDKVLELDADASAASISLLQTVKGWFYVTATALILFSFIKKHLGKLRSTEAELEKHRMHLAELVDEKTKDLDEAVVKLQNVNQQLTDQNKLIDKQNQDLLNALNEVRSTQVQLAQADRMAAIGILTTGISHELQTPLKAIEENTNEMLEKIRRENYDISDLPIMVETVKKSTQRISTVLSGMMQLSSSSYSSHEKCELHTIIDNCMAILNYHLTDRIRIEKNYNNEPIYISGNPGQLHQAIISIMINAVQAIKSEGVISFTTTVDQQQAFVSIADNGCGIDDCNLPHVTDPFFTTKDPGKGSGLGLSITYTIIKNHGGKLKIDSNKSKGTTVHISLPIIIQE